MRISLRDLRPSPQIMSRLTPRQREVALEILRGYSSQQSAFRMSCHLGTILGLRRRIRKAFGVETTSDVRVILALNSSKENDRV